jgi:hypothetical protein
VLGDFPIDYLGRSVSTTSRPSVLVVTQASWPLARAAWMRANRSWRSMSGNVARRAGCPLCPVLGDKLRGLWFTGFAALALWRSVPWTNSRGGLDHRPAPLVCNRAMIEAFRHPLSDYEVTVKQGFCWPALFFGCFCYARGLWGWALLWAVVGFFTVGFGWIVAGFVANGQLRTHLLRQGYRRVGIR